ncbi:hypothetical protein Pmar_PMAR021858, partial [Perkinsus marinus ATCC 50983]
MVTIIVNLPCSRKVIDRIITTLLVPVDMLAQDYEDMDDRGPSGEPVVPLVQSGSVSTRPSTATDWNSMTSGRGDRDRTVEQVDEMATNGT